MSKDRDEDLAALLKAVLAEDDGLSDVPDEAPEPAPPVSEFEKQLHAALLEAIGIMRQREVIEIEDDSIEPLVAEITEAGLDTKSPKQLIIRVIKSLLESDHVDEVYGTDEEISQLLRSLLGGD